MTEVNPHRLNLADQILVNTLAALCLRVAADRNRDQMLLDTLGEILPRTTRTNPRLSPVIDEARKVTSLALGADNPRALALALTVAGRALVHFFEWRAAMALDADRKAQSEEVVV